MPKWQENVVFSTDDSQKNEISRERGRDAALWKKKKLTYNFEQQNIFICKLQPYI